VYIANRKMKICYLCEHKIVAEHMQEDDLSAEDDPRLEEDDNELKCICTCHSTPNLILR
jgi:hypothetical protein